MLWLDQGDGKTLQFTLHDPAWMPRLGEQINGRNPAYSILPCAYRVQTLRTVSTSLAGSRLTDAWTNVAMCTPFPYTTQAAGLSFVGYPRYQSPGTHLTGLFFAHFSKVKAFRHVLTPADK
jgi:hypothetical protein